MSLILMFFSFCICFFMLLLAYILIKKDPSDLEKNSPFECGFNPSFKARIPFSMHFFLIALLFVIFDIELILLLPSPMNMKTLTYSFSISIFIFIITAGLYYEWNNNALTWVYSYN